MYNQDNIFAKIIRHEIPADVVYEDDLVLAFNDISKAAPIHILVIPKGEFTNFVDFVQKAKSDEVADFFKKVSKIAKKADIKKEGFRIISNIGDNAHQTVEHFHVHILAGRKLGPLLVSGDTNSNL